MVLVERTNDAQVVVIVFDDEQNLDLRTWSENTVNAASGSGFVGE